MTDPEADYLLAAEELRTARLAFATAFVRFRMGGSSNTQALQQAIVETESALDTAQARADVAKHRMEHGGRTDPHES